MTTIFITGSMRSGTTSLLQALGLSRYAQIALEPMPTLNIESRELYEGRLSDPYSILARDVVPRVAKALDKGKVYIEKHISFIPFISYLRDWCGRCSLCRKSKGQTYKFLFQNKNYGHCLTF